MNIALVILITILIILIVYLIVRYLLADNVTPFVSKYDGDTYEIRKVGSTETMETAADYLAKITENINKLVDYMYRNELPDRETATRLYHRWSVCELKETPSFEKSAAYTLNKSSEIRICIRNGKQFENINTSMFVVLHELAHVMSIGFGHGEEFKDNFSYIVNTASNIGVYYPQNFNESPTSYCGVEINTTPCNEHSCEYKTVPV
jgi:hypothetical protein